MNKKRYLTLQIQINNHNINWKLNSDFKRLIIFKITHKKQILKITRMKTFIKAKLNKSDEQTIIDKYGVVM